MTNVRICCRNYFSLFKIEISFVATLKATSKKDSVLKSSSELVFVVCVIWVDPVVTAHSVMLRYIQ